MKNIPIQPDVVPKDQNEAVKTAELLMKLACTANDLTFKIREHEEAAAALREQLAVCRKQYQETRPEISGTLQALTSG